MPKPDRNPLQDLYELIEKGQITKDIQYKNKVFTFRSLNDEDYIWRDQLVNASNYLSLMSSQRAPTLAIATVAVDGIPVEQMDLDQYPDDYPKALRISQPDNTFIIAYNLWKKLYSKMPRNYLIGLHNLYVDEIELPSQKVSEEDVKKS